MLMKFNIGDRVHVTRINHEDVDFYGTISYIEGYLMEINSCSDHHYRTRVVYAPNHNKFGKEKFDYYTLSTDEEDTEEPEVQFNEEAWRQAGKNIRNFMNGLNDKLDNDTHDTVNKPSHYMLGDIEVKDIIAIVADKYHKGSVAHNVASALEYQMRAPEKNGLEDIKKARKCLDFAIENWE
ncbi:MULTISPECIES: DUF3310 domain-containing protein [unclassified Mammaliicoccus]|uniref:DUF3310 domain-containing protein n=1 Tax=unclassified Mammaliicoccus TaxID=2803851 RepID=UPI001EFAE591|nr:MULTISPECIES: DUF3310 domain-containing protein [unclassified Mammaliicoccus]